MWVDGRRGPVVVVGGYGSGGTGGAGTGLGEWGRDGREGVAVVERCAAC